MDAGGRRGKVNEFVGVTGTSDEFAASFLKANDWDLQAAVNTFLEQDATSGSPMRSDKIGNGGIGNGKIGGDKTWDTDRVRAPIPVKVDKLFTHGIVGRPSGVREPFRNFGQEWSKSTRKNKSLASLFTLAPDIGFRGDFDEACAAARKRNCWVVVNIQNVEEFRCHALIRDTWKNKRIERIIRERFVFWQKEHTADSGKRFCQFYHATEFPYVCLIDPRTKEELLRWQNLEELQPKKLEAELNDFLANHDLSASSSSKANKTLKVQPDEAQQDGSFMDTANETKRKRKREEATLKEPSPKKLSRTIIPEPPVGDASTGVRIRIGPRCTVKRRFLKTTTVQGICDYVQYEVDDKEFREKLSRMKFFLVTTFPKKTLNDFNMTIQDANLINTSLAVEWINQ